MAILSYEYFQRRYGLNPAILGHAMFTNGQFTQQVIGVLAPRFQLYFPPASNEETAPEVWIANRLGYDAADRNGVSIRAVGILKNDVSLEQAQAAADIVAAAGRKNFLIDGTAGYAIRLEAIRLHLVSAVRPAILAPIVAVIVLLVIASATLP